MYRHFPTREALPAAVLQTRSVELVARQEEIVRLGDADEVLEQWLGAPEEYFSALSGLPEPLMVAARAQDPDNPLTLPCETVITATEECVQAAQRTGCIRESKGYDRFLAAISVAWLKVPVPWRRSRWNRVRALIVVGHRERNTEA
ncbi:TetR/AcrR family transcriptional regulator [Streptomyces sp. TLI_185]|uniref:TetR/AcrR family transcriptional regulator n=1 Tax=Streptomyces sp. TLI_185 TaxID=2485151 RepID=UPI0021A822D0|nr:TetR/AcrR family transcriptional regulator [Streptomyces sp. TLI_185]